MWLNLRAGAPAGVFPGGPGAPRFGGVAEGFGGQGGVDEPSLTSGLTIVGISTEPELIAKSKQEGLDVLMLFDVNAELNVKTQRGTYDTKVALYDVARNRRLVRTRALNNVRIQNARRANLDDGVQNEVDAIFKFIDEKLSMSVLPEALNKENVQARVSSLASSSHDNLLPVLTEIRFWNDRQLLDEAAVLQAYTQLVGEEVAKSLASGSEEERKTVVERWVPAQDSRGRGGDREPASSW